MILTQKDFNLRDDVIDHWIYSRNNDNKLEIKNITSTRSWKAPLWYGHSVIRKLEATGMAAKDGSKHQ